MEGPKLGIGGCYRIPELDGSFDNGEKWKDSIVLYILKLEGLGWIWKVRKRDSSELIDAFLAYWGRRC